MKAKKNSREKFNKKAKPKLYKSQTHAGEGRRKLLYTKKKYKL